MWPRLAVYLMTKKSANASEGYCQEGFFFFFLITSIWLEPKILVFKVLCQVSDVRKDRSYKDLQEIAKILSDMANQTGDRWGGSDNPTWPVATVAHYKQDISAH